MPVQIFPAMQEYLPAVLDLMLSQQERHYRLDPRLHLRTRAEVEAQLAMWQQRGQLPLVALDASKRVRGYVQPAIWELAAHSVLHAFLSARNGVALNLTLPDPTDEDAHGVADALLTALSQFWRQQESSGDLIRWPSADPWLEPELLARGFRLDSVCAAHPFQPLTGREHAGSSALVIRPAQSEDEDMVVALFEEELGYHERCTPFVRRSPRTLAAFRRTLSRLWAGQPLAAGGTLVLVAELDGQIVAMAEQSVLDLLPDAEPGFTPPGRYGVKASQAGAATPLAFVLSAVGVLLLSVPVVYFARHLSSAGGFSTWVRHGLGPFAAFQVGWLMLGAYSLFEAALQATVGGSLH